MASLRTVLEESNYQIEIIFKLMKLYAHLQWFFLWRSGFLWRGGLVLGVWRLAGLGLGHGLDIGGCHCWLEVGGDKIGKK